MRDDVQLHTAVNPSDMEGGIGNIIIIILRTILAQLILRGANLARQVTGKMQRIDRQWRQRRMAGPAVAMRPNRCLALMAGAKPHLGWLTDDAHCWPEGGFGHHLDHRAHANAADFLVMGQRQMQRRAQWQPAGGNEAGNRCGAKALHVCRAASIKPAILLGAGKGWPGPVLSVDRHNIGVAGQHHAAIIRLLWAGAGKQIGLLATIIGNHRHADSGIIQPVGNIIYQRPVRVTADRGKADQIMKNFNCLGHHTPFCQRLRC